MSFHDNDNPGIESCLSCLAALGCTTFSNNVSGTRGAHAKGVVWADVIVPAETVVDDRLALVRCFERSGVEDLPAYGAAVVVGRMNGTRWVGA